MKSIALLIVFVLSSLIISAQETITVAPLYPLGNGSLDTASNEANKVKSSDIIKLKNGEEIEGTISKYSNGKYFVAIGKIVKTINEEDILSINSEKLIAPVSPTTGTRDAIVERYSVAHLKPSSVWSNFTVGINGNLLFCADEDSFQATLKSGKWVRLNSFGVDIRHASSIFSVEPSQHLLFNNLDYTTFCVYKDNTSKSKYKSTATANPLLYPVDFSFPNKLYVMHYDTESRRFRDIYVIQDGSIEGPVGMIEVDSAFYSQAFIKGVRHFALGLVLKNIVHNNDGSNFDGAHGNIYARLNASGLFDYYNNSDIRNSGYSSKHDRIDEFKMMKNAEGSYSLKKVNSTMVLDIERKLPNNMFVGNQYLFYGKCFGMVEAKLIHAKLCWKENAVLGVTEGVLLLSFFGAEERKLEIPFGKFKGNHASLTTIEDPKTSSLTFAVLLGDTDEVVLIK